MTNTVVLDGYDIALGDRITGSVKGIHGTSGTAMETKNFDITVQGFQMGTGDMNATQQAFALVEIMPMNPSAGAESHYMLRVPVIHLLFKVPGQLRFSKHLGFHRSLELFSSDCSTQIYLICIECIYDELVFVFPRIGRWTWSTIT